MSNTVYEYSCQTTGGDKKSLKDYEGKVLLVVNTASKCGFTPQFGGLEEMYENYKDKGLEILGFPCNQFGKQDPGSNDEIMEFCQLNYGVSFPMFGKFRHLKKAAPGALGTEGIKWNFTKFLIDRSGTVIKRYAPKDAPKAIAKDIEKLLA
jgi:glutathione peroxidase